MDLAQRQHRQPDRPQTEAPNPGLALRDQARVLERIAQVRVRDPEQMIKAFLEARRKMRVLEPLEAEIAAAENRARQPAGLRAAIVPDILQDIGHLQSLTERDGELHHALAVSLELRAMQQKELGQHLADDARHVVAVRRHLLEIVEPFETSIARELR